MVSMTFYNNVSEKTLPDCKSTLPPLKHNAKNINFHQIPFIHIFFRTHFVQSFKYI